MSSPSYESNVFTIIRQQITEDIKNKLLESLIEDALSVIRDSLREKVKPMVEGIAIEDIERLRNAFKMREELHVSIHWKE